MLPVSQQLMAELDLTTAVRDEAVWNPDLVPKPLIDHVASDDPSFFASHIANVAEAGLDIRPAGVAFASKWRYGRRPVVLLPFAERVLHRAVVELLSPQMEPLKRSQEAYEAFQRAPLLDGAKFVVSTDLANFHSSIPTDLLARELTQRTGRWEPVEWLRNFYLRVSGGHIGIPQGSIPSTMVSEVYANELHRRMVLRGLSVWRYADDFRISAAGPIECVEALDILEEEARRLGLFVNERKTSYLSRSRYELRVEAPDARLRQISEQVKNDLTEIDFYSGQVIAPEDAEVHHDVAMEILDYWHEERRSADKTNVGIEIETVKLVRYALTVLATLRSPAGLPFCSALLRLEPQLTPEVATYLSAELASSVEIARIIERASLDLPLTKWQSVWLLTVLSNRPISPQGNLKKWTLRCAADATESLQVAAAWALAQTTSLPGDLWRELSLKTTRYGSPYLAAARKGTTPEQPKLSGFSDALDKRVAEWVDGKWMISPF